MAMNQDDFEALMDRIDEVFNEVQYCRRAIEYLEDHTNDVNLMSALGMIRQGLSRAEIKIDEIMRCPDHHAADHPKRCPKCGRPMHRFHHCELNPVADPDL